MSANRPAGAAATALALLLIAGCGSTGGTGTSIATGRVDPANGPVTSLAEARARWAAVRVDEYQLVVGHSCFCTKHGAVRVTVGPGRPAAVTVVDSQYPNGSQTPPADTPTSVEALFDLVAAEQSSAEKVDVTYDQATGVPIRIFADRMVQATDDEDTVEVSYTPGPAAPGPATPGPATPDSQPPGSVATADPS